MDPSGLVYDNVKVAETFRTSLERDVYLPVFYPDYTTSQPRAIGVIATHEANESVKHVLEKLISRRKAKKHKQHTHLTDVDRAEITKHAATIAKIRSQSAWKCQKHRFLIRKLL